MQLTTVESSMLYAVGYNSKTRTLEVVFNSGGIYQYHDVPPGEYAGLMELNRRGVICTNASLTYTLGHKSNDAVNNRAATRLHA